MGDVEGPNPAQDERKKLPRVLREILQVSDLV
jgi:hypothetical protein